MLNKSGNIGTTEKDWLEKFKDNFKNHPVIYEFFVNTFAPVHSNKKARKMFFDRLPDKGVYLNIGAGVRVFDERFLKCDIFPYKTIDFLCDAEALPFPDNSFDAIVNIALLEHTRNPEKIMSEIFRVLNERGMVYTLVPFLQGFHAAPFDYLRWTKPGLELLHAKFIVKYCGVCGGPTSTLLWVFQEWLALAFSLGFVPLYRIVLIFLMLITWPIKYIDILLYRHPMAHTIANSFDIIAIKQELPI